MLQLGIYTGTDTATAVFDTSDLLVSVGVVFLEGDYANDGTWTATREPRPADHLDDADPWFFQYHTIMNFRAGIHIDNTLGTVGYDWDKRPYKMSFNRQVDTSPYRKAKYGQKLHIGAQVLTSNEASWTEPAHELYLNWNFRILQSEWG